MRELQLSFISNQATIRLFKLLNYIERNRVFTIREIAEEFDISQRTIANDIRYLKDHFEKSALFSSGSNGFIFEEVNFSLYKEQKKVLLENEVAFELIQNIFYGKLDRVDELAHFYNYSETTFRRILTKCSPLLKSYGLKWVSNPLRIAGSEASLRKFFKDFFYEGIETPYSVIPDPRLRDLVISRLGDQLSLDAYQIATGTTPTAFYYTFFIAIKRAEQGLNTTIPSRLLEYVYKEKDFLLLFSLEREVHDVFGVKLPKEEFAWVYLVTICNRTFNHIHFEKNFYDHFNLWPEIESISEDYLKELQIKQGKHTEELATFLKSFFLSIKIKDSIEPVLNKAMIDILSGIELNSVKSYDQNLSFLRRCKKRLALSDKYTQDICTSLTVYSGILIDYYMPPKRIFFLLEGNHLAYQYIRVRAIKLFGDKHSLVFVPIQFLSQEKLNRLDIDLIVTNYSRYVSDYIHNIDYLLIKEIPDERDWANITSKLNQVLTN